MVTPEERREAKKSLIKNGAFLLGFAALVVLAIATMLSVEGGFRPLGAVLIFLALVLVPIYLLVRFIKWAATRK